MNALLVSGWAYPENSLQPLAEILSRHVATTVTLPNMNLTSSADWLIGWSWGGMLAIEQIANAAAGRSDLKKQIEPFPPYKEQESSSLCRAGTVESLRNLPAENKTRGLVLISTTARFCASADYPFGQPTSIVRAMQKNLATHPEHVLNDFFALAASPHAAAKIHLTDSPSLRNGLDYLLKTDLRDTVKRINVPTLVLHGQQDKIIPFDAGRWLAENIPNARLENLDEMGHDLPVRRPDWVAKQIIDFIKQYS